MLASHSFGKRLLGLAVLVLAILVLAACGTSATPTPPPTAVPATAPTPVATATPTNAPVADTSPGPDWKKLGFPNVVATQDLTPGNAVKIQAGPYTFQVPADAFADPVRFEVLTGDLTHLQAKAPTGETPILAFALDVTDLKTNQLIQGFAKPIVWTATDSHITAQSKFYNLGPDGTYGPNPAGTQVSAGMLTHSLTTAGVGRVITNPK
jgi:hypothetical protein